MPPDEGQAVLPATEGEEGMTMDVERAVGKTITIVVHLPISTNELSRLMTGLTGIWPDAAIDYSGEWRIDVGADVGRDADMESGAT